MSLLPLFPLQIVVFPDEKLPLHIFEKRYRELLKDIEISNGKFGIPTLVNGKMTYGTEIELVETVKNYENGSSDILCRGKRVFFINEFKNPMDGKLYAGGDVKFFNNIYDGNPSTKEKVLALISELYEVMNVDIPDIDTQEFNSFTLGHKIGMSVVQELELLHLIYESERLKYIKEHLKKIIPVVKEVNRTKEIIKMNGHFRSFDPLDFKKIR
ncbi:LON peptidase substrate-binding domain-containing protein [Ascidiimonas sp. W6]|uniref:LON peptidase substrate-binding domain-containing protein n=1 Tax=Ascidiimonas meishanensis TaxID=3128903 RepID=UPI0030EB61E8